MAIEKQQEVLSCSAAILGLARLSGESRLLNDALKFAKLGFPVFPLTPGQKIPVAGESWLANATLEPDKIKALWLRHRNANIGLALGQKANVVAIDLDKGATEADLARFPRTVTARTKNGYHLFFRWSEKIGNTKEFTLPKEDGSVGPTLNIRSTGYYVVGVGSVVAEWEYRWHADAGGELSPADLPYAEIPAWVLPGSSSGDTNAKQAQANEPNQTTHKSDGKIYGENGRHAFFVKAATAMRKEGKGYDQILHKLHGLNQNNCVPPKENCDNELRKIVSWVFETVGADQQGNGQRGEGIPEGDQRHADQRPLHFVLPLGHREGDYFYTSSSNREIVKLGRGSHSKSGLLDLMPYEYWNSKYPMGEKGMAVNWDLAGSDLMEGCRQEGVFNERKIRGLGCWREDQKIVVHLGNRLFVDGEYKQLHEGKQGLIYALGAELADVNSNPLSVEECRVLLDACQAPSWKHPSSGVLLAGGLALFRICGALPWRPMLWLTGASGSGKTTLVSTVIGNIGGSFAVRAVGNSSEAGIRQELHCASRPVIFDEAETNDKRSSNRVKSILELVRQASSDTDDRILKGTPDGRGHNFKVNSSFILSSIRINLTEEADANRFSVLELNRNNPKDWPTVSAKLAAVTTEIGDRLFARSVKMFPVITASKLVLERVIASKADMRTGQQYGSLLAGYWMTQSDNVITEDEARLLCEILPKEVKAKDSDDEQDEYLCLARLLDAKLRIGTEESTIRYMILSKSTETITALMQHGIKADDTSLTIQNQNPNIEPFYRDTKWEKNWSNSLRRLPGAQDQRVRFGGANKRCVVLPTGLTHLV